MKSSLKVWVAVMLAVIGLTVCTGETCNINVDGFGYGGGYYYTPPVYIAPVYDYSCWDCGGGGFDFDWW